MNPPVPPTWLFVLLKRKSHMFWSVYFALCFPNPHPMSSMSPQNGKVHGLKGSSKSVSSFIVFFLKLHNPNSSACKWDLLLCFKGSGTAGKTGSLGKKPGKLPTLMFLFHCFECHWWLTQYLFTRARSLTENQKNYPSRAEWTPWHPVIAYVWL